MKRAAADEGIARSYKRPLTFVGLLTVLGLIFLLGRVMDLRRQNSPEGRAAAALATEKAANDAAIDMAEMLVKFRLRDPESAQFAGSSVSRINKQEAVCGLVNSKNGYGGMAGDEWFAVKGTDVLLASDGPDAVRRMGQLCGH
ncbi:MAG: hypothetical protein JWM75_2485 [Sphingomonas bacterium]|nr:hypothetical protein [Sphingomonas bacterium]